MPVLGLCLGMQLLFEGSEEHGGAEGLGLLGGRGAPLAPTPPTLKLPHIGWNEVRFDAALAAAGGAAATAPPSTTCTRSRRTPRDDEDVLGVGDYGERFASIVARGHVFGVQFHPEKSSAARAAPARELRRAVRRAATA